MPSEWAAHARTCMAWPPSGSVWQGSDGIAVQNDIAGSPG
ncbi:agmatine deiminase family protein [Nocardia sp. NBC_01503]|nr:agmatine deiminase family protein [Nocardia sp. NBC_01503]